MIGVGIGGVGTGGAVMVSEAGTLVGSSGLRVEEEGVEIDDILITRFNQGAAGMEEVQGRGLEEERKKRTMEREVGEK